MNAVAQHEKSNPVTKTEETPRSYISPEVNIYETENGYTLEAEMPGVARDQLELTLENNALILVGHRTDNAPHGTVLYRESRPADYRRVFELDPAIDSAKIRAQMHQGLLVLELPKAEAVKPRRIAVT